ncbi:LysE family translocator [Bremerella sp. JC817]|uniref:LysE family translocator n=1 Tax=Bremerella sp. JC817 TaxID=3231756 RepID=UPI00345B0C38
MPPIESLPYFFLAMLVISITPGPDMLGILSYGIARGRQAGMGFAFGVGLGTLFHTLLAVVGISAIVATSPWAFRGIIYAGASYLIYLGTKALLKPGSIGEESEEVAVEKSTARPGFWPAAMRGFLCNALNPKVGLFFLAFLPQFINPQQPAWSQLLVLGVVFWLWTTFSYSLLGYYCGVVGSWLRGRQSTGRWIDRVTGGLFVGLGLHLIFTGQKS